MIYNLLVSFVRPNRWNLWKCFLDLLYKREQCPELPVTAKSDEKEYHLNLYNESLPLVRVARLSYNILLGVT